MSRSRTWWVAAALCFGCTSLSNTAPPTHEQLVTHHLEGRYAQVIAWCPVMLENDGSPAATDWCMYGYPAALRLSLDNKAAAGFVHSVCRDITGQPKGEQDFREFYVTETARWVGLAMRMQGRGGELDRGLRATLEDFSEICAVEAEHLRHHVDTRIKTKREMRES